MRDFHVPTARPIRNPNLFVRGGTPPVMPALDGAGAPIGAAPTSGPPVQHRAIFHNSDLVNSIAFNRPTETQTNHYYWHHDGGVDYVHYYAGNGAQWYGFNLGAGYYWTRYHAGRWWWYDPGARRYLYYGNGYWWYQNPVAPQVVYVYRNDSYMPYEPAAPPPADDASSAPAETEAPVLHSDVDDPSYSLKTDPDRLALVVGVENYAALPKADFAERDAEAMRAHLRHLGYADRNVVVLTSSQAARSSIAKYVESWLPAHATGKTSVFVYFSGHGAPDPTSGATYLMPWDGDAKYLANTGYPLKDLYAHLNALPSKNIMVVLDSCFSGAGGRSVLAEGVRPLVTKMDLGRGSVGKVVVLTASSDDEITGSLPDQGHGLFTYYFLKGLNGAARAGENGVSAQDLYDYVEPNVADAARRDNSDQTPQLFGPPDESRSLLFKDLR